MDAGPLPDRAAAPSPPAAGAWSCGACGYANDAGRLCARCGVSRAWLADPPLDVPPMPGWFERPAAWLALLHAAIAALGLVLLARPEIAPYLALTPTMQGAQVLASLAAAGASLNRAAMERLFWRIDLEVPERSPARRALPVRARLVPYERTDRVRVRVAVVSNTYGSGTSGRGTRSVIVSRERLMRGGVLPGRRSSDFEAALETPFPTGGHRDITAELEASALGAFAWLVPGLGEIARNLREHGGVWVRLDVRVGPWRRRIERRVFVFHLEGDRFEIA